MESFVQNRLRALRRGYDQSYGNGIWPDKALGAPLSGSSDEDLAPRPKPAPMAQNPAMGQPLSGGDPQTPVSPEPALNPIQALFQRIASSGITSAPPTLPAQQTFVKGQDSSQGGQGGQQQNQGFKWQPPSAGMYGGPGPTDTAIDVGNMGLDIGNTALGAVDGGMGAPLGADPAMGQPVSPSTDPNQQTQVPEPQPQQSNPLADFFHRIFLSGVNMAGKPDIPQDAAIGQFDIGSALGSAGVGQGASGMGGLSSLGSGISGLISSFYKNIPSFTFTPPNVAQITPPTFQFPQLSSNTGGELPYTV